MKRFDLNGNGLLEAQEDELAQSDEAWGRQMESRRSEQIRASMELNQEKWQALFDQVDLDSSGAVSYEEFLKLMKNHPELLGSRLHGVSGLQVDIVRPFDADGNFQLDRTEFYRLLAVPRLLAELYVSGDWLRWFGLNPAFYDKNENGRLDVDERWTMLKRLRKRIRSME